MALKVMPDVVSGQTIRSLKPADSALAAARMMREHDVSAIVILDDAGLLVGIVTERDLARRVAAEDKQASAVPISEVMTPQPLTVGPATLLFDALEEMRKHRVRHLPVVEEGRVLGMVSMRDLRHAIGAKTGRRPKSALGRMLGAVRGPRR
jgi:CBS domain-containing protein